jgi:RNA polymerase sigma factor (sigma-70 family)
MTQIQFNNALINLQNKLHIYALKLTSNAENANDLLQETLLKALTYRDKFAQNTNIRALCYTIMKNTFINDYRRNIKLKNYFEASIYDFQIQFSKDIIHAGPDIYFNTKEIYSIIHSLEDDYKVPFTMFLDGYKYKEIGRQLALPLGTVKSRIFSARKKLEKALNN